ncbi:hypothetical protein AB1N83_007856 [Pleurotus pulmonarius]
MSPSLKPQRFLFPPPPRGAALSQCRAYINLRWSLDGGLRSLDSKHGFAEGTERYPWGKVGKVSVWWSKARVRAFIALAYRHVSSANSSALRPIEQYIYILPSSKNPPDTRPRAIDHPRTSFPAVDRVLDNSEPPGVAGPANWAARTAARPLSDETD